MQNGVQLVVENSNSNAITIAGSGANIVSEAESNIVKWDINNNVGTYVVPFSKSTGEKIPLSLIIDTAGTGNGELLFSTYSGATWDNSLYLPSDVNNFSASCCSNNSPNVIDRFWIIEAQNYTKKPSPTILFSYLDAEHSAALNTINESSLFAQRFNPAPVNSWGDWYGAFGTANTSSNIVSTGSVSSSDFFRSWTLVNQANPLPIELIHFETTCKQSHWSFRWTTATEINSSFFTIEKSIDALTWIGFADIPAMGNSQVFQNYVFEENEELFSEQVKTAYFRLKLSDVDGQLDYSEVISAPICVEEMISVLEYPNPNSGRFDVDISGLDESAFADIVVTDVLGNIVFKKGINLIGGGNIQQIDISDQKPGMYYLSVYNSCSLLHTQKIIYQ